MLNIKWRKGAAIAEAICLAGLEKLKDRQMDAINSFLDGNDVFVSLPTGYGKSVIDGILLYSLASRRFAERKKRLETLCRKKLARLEC